MDTFSNLVSNIKIKNLFTYMYTYNIYIYVCHVPFKWIPERKYQQKGPPKDPIRALIEPYASPL